jgi:tRNA threonylcarbamoyl adenosine modification protein YeaZ
VLVVALDTSTPACSVALVSVSAAAGPGAGAAVSWLAGRVTIDPRRHGEVLAPSIAAVLAEAGVKPSELDAAVVGTGPGPFTSLRVGMVTGAALGAALGIAVYGVCSLDALAATRADEPPDGEPPAGAGNAEGHVPALAGAAFAVATDARRRELYWAAYRPAPRAADGPQSGVAGPGGPQPGVAGLGVAGPDCARPSVGERIVLERIGPEPTVVVRIAGPAVDRPAEAAARMRELGVGRVVGAGGALYPEAFGGFARPGEPLFPSALALARLAAGPVTRREPPPPLVPLYLRRPDAVAPHAPKAVTG